MRVLPDAPAEFSALAGDLKKLGIVLWEKGRMDSGAIGAWGAPAQARLQDISRDLRMASMQQMERGARGLLDGMAARLREFALTGDDLRARRTFREWLLGRPAPLAGLRMRMAALQSAIDRLAGQLARQQFELLREQERTRLLRGRLAVLETELSALLAQGREAIERLDAMKGPEGRAILEAAGDGQRPVLRKQMDSLLSVADDMERRLRDLAMTRQVALQSGASLALMDDNATGLSERIGMILDEMVPLWERHLSAALQMGRAEGSADREGKAAAIAGANAELARAVADSLALAAAQPGG